MGKQRNEKQQSPTVEHKELYSIFSDKPHEKHKYIYMYAERINQLTRFCTAKFCTFSMSWALGLVWLEGGGEDKLPLTQKPEGISGFHL